MKITITRSLGCAFVAAACATGQILVAPVASAAAPSAVTEAAATLTAQVSVPSNGQAVTYVLNGKKVTINPGETKEIPAGAKSIKLPAGTSFTITKTPTKKGEAASSNTYTVGQDVTLGSLSAKTLEANSSAFTLASQSGNIKLPSGTIADLLHAVSSSSRNTVNPFNVLNGEDVTDGNQNN